jgi:hypothetical protein
LILADGCHHQKAIARAGIRRQGIEVAAERSIEEAPCQIFVGSAEDAAAIPPLLDLCGKSGERRRADVIIKRMFEVGDRDPFGDLPCRGASAR